MLVLHNLLKHLISSYFGCSHGVRYVCVSTNLFHPRNSGYGSSASSFDPLELLIVLINQLLKVYKCVKIDHLNNGNLQVVDYKTICVGSTKCED